MKNSTMPFATMLAALKGDIEGLLNTVGQLRVLQDGNVLVLQTDDRTPRPMPPGIDIWAVYIDTNGEAGFVATGELTLEQTRGILEAMSESKATPREKWVMRADYARDGRIYVNTSDDNGELEAEVQVLEEGSRSVTLYFDDNYCPQIDMFDADGNVVQN